MQSTTLGLTATTKHSRVYPITLEDSPIYRVEVFSMRLKTKEYLTCKTSTERAKLIQTFNDSGMFQARVI